MNSAANVSTAKPKVGGAMFRAPLNTVLPTNATSELGDAFVCLGYISEDGMKNSMSRSTEEERAWGGDVVNVTEKDHADKFTTKLIESLNPDVLKTVFGEKNVTGTLDTGIHIRVNASEHEDSVYVVDMILKGGVLKRMVIPNGRITDVAEIVYSDTASTGYDVTVTCQADADGDTHHEYICKEEASATVAVSEGGE